MTPTVAAPALAPLCPLCGQPALLGHPPPSPRGYPRGPSPSERVDRELERRAEDRLARALEEIAGVDGPETVRRRA